MTANFDICIAANPLRVDPAGSPFRLTVSGNYQAAEPQTRDKGGNIIDPRREAYFEDIRVEKVEALFDYADYDEAPILSVAVLNGSWLEAKFQDALLDAANEALLKEWNKPEEKE